MSMHVDRNKIKTTNTHKSGNSKNYQFLHLTNVKYYQNYQSNENMYSETSNLN